MSYIESLTADQIIKWAIGLSTALSVFIEITPIKVNPWTKILSSIGKLINKDITDKVAVLDNKIEIVARNLNNLENNCDKNDAIGCRVRILQFGDELRRDVKHSKENFTQVLSDIDTYEFYCKTHPEFKNSKTVTTEKIIKDVYERCLTHNEFL